MDKNHHLETNLVEQHMDHGGHELLALSLVYL